MKRIHSMAGLVALTFGLWGNLAMAEISPVREPQVCLECHIDLEDSFKASHVHTAFADGECSSCHNPHASRHAGLLAENGRALCLTCHDDLASAAALAVPHPPVANGDCLGCHDPHASAHAGVLKLGLVATCVTCHTSAATWSEKAVVHPPVRKGNCQTCHQVHGSEVEGMLATAVPGNCFKCHTRGAKFKSAHGGKDIADSDCIACHDPHASNEKGLLRANQHKPFASGNCEQCHAGLSKGASYAFSGSPQETCLKCHRGVGSYTKAKYQHNLGSAESCLACHNPHASNETNLLKRSQEQMCMGCHFNDKEDKAAWGTHPGVQCTECHEPHGNDDPQLIKSRDTMLCGGCHESAHQVTHPVGEEVIDPRTGESVNCLSCHQLHGARFEKYLPLSSDMELCIQCHKR